MKTKNMSLAVIFISTFLAGCPGGGYDGGGTTYPNITTPYPAPTKAAMSKN